MKKPKSMATIFAEAVLAGAMTGMAGAMDLRGGHASRLVAPSAFNVSATRFLDQQSIARQEVREARRLAFKSRRVQGLKHEKRFHQ